MKKSIKNLSAVTTVGLDIAKNVFQIRGVHPITVTWRRRGDPTLLCG